MKLFALEALISVVYVFDVSAYPFVHVPFVFLTLLYFGSMVELFGLVRILRFMRLRLARASGRGRTYLLRAGIPTPV